MANDDQLNGWKEIAAYLGKSPRAAQRWESDLSLPVRRMRTPKGGEIVYALKSEIEQWKLDAGARRELDQTTVEPGDEETTAPAQVQPALPPTRARTATHRYALIAVLALTIAAIVVVASRIPGDRAAANPAGPALEMVLASDAPGGLDSGPWPTAGYDTRRSGRTVKMSGPASPGTARAMYSAAIRGEYTPMAVLSSGTILIGACGSVTALDANGRQLWMHTLERRGFNEEPGGFTVDGNGHIYFSTGECPDQLDSIRLGTYAMLPTGEVYWHRQHSSTHQAPAIGPDGTVYTFDETDTVHAYGPDGTVRWATDLPGYGQGLIAVARDGSLVIGNDGGLYNMTSLWVLDGKTGRVRWTAFDGALTTPMLLSTTSMVVPDQRGSIFAVHGAGHRTWTLEVGGRMGAMPMSLGPSGIYVRTTDALVAVTTSGTRRWEVRAPVPALLALGPLVDRDENLYTFDETDVLSLTPAGATRWRVPLRGVRHIAIAAEGLLYAVSGDGLYTIRDSGPR
jgi:hypothetical protein